MKILVVAILLTFSTQAFSWGEQGHAIVNETAALLLAEKPEHEFMRERSFDLGYFANVPDRIWKQEKTYNIEVPQHFMDMEIFERELKLPPVNAHTKIKTPMKVDEAFHLDREEFDAKYPKIPVKAGRSWWRIREIYDLLQKQAQFLADNKMTLKERHELQAEWMVLAGVLGHYVGDLSQPLHCTENYDGAMTSQKGIHSYFEDKMVNLLVPKLRVEVLNEAKKLWPAFTKSNKDVSTLGLIAALTQYSESKVRTLLNIDKKQNRKNFAANAKAYDELIVHQMAQGAMTLAELWQRTLDWKYNGQGFFTFISTPDYIMPGTAKSNHFEEVKDEK